MDFSGVSVWKFCLALISSLLLAIRDSFVSNVFPSHTIKWSADSTNGHHTSINLGSEFLVAIPGSNAYWGLSGEFSSGNILSLAEPRAKGIGLIVFPDADVKAWTNVFPVSKNQLLVVNGYSIQSLSLYEFEGKSSRLIYEKSQADLFGHFENKPWDSPEFGGPGSFALGLEDDVWMLIDIPSKDSCFIARYDIKSGALIGRSDLWPSTISFRGTFFSKEGGVVAQISDTQFVYLDQNFKIKPDPFLRVLEQRLIEPGYTSLFYISKNSNFALIRSLGETFKGPSNLELFRFENGVLKKSIVKLDRDVQRFQQAYLDPKENFIITLAENEEGNPVLFGGVLPIRKEETLTLKLLTELPDRSGQYKWTGAWLADGSGFGIVSDKGDFSFWASDVFLAKTRI